MTLSASDITKIIKAGHDANVSEITIGDLYISFNGAKCPESLTDEANSPNLVPRSTPITASEDDAIDQDEELTHALLSDPAAYEELVDIE